MKRYVAVWSLLRGPLASEPLDADGQAMARLSERAERAVHARRMRVEFIGDQVVWASAWRQKPPKLSTSVESRERVRGLMKLAAKGRCA